MITYVVEGSLKEVWHGSVGSLYRDGGLYSRREK